jgi:two-component system, OmpR family, phosphate regulon response regulator PhoB
MKSLDVAIVTLKETNERAMSDDIIVIEDEAAVREMICFNLKSAGFDYREAADVPAGMRLVHKLHPALMLIDWMLPGESGLDMVHRLNMDPDTSEIPIILLTARGEEDDKIVGLEGGADDYIVKPFSPRELVARIRALLRRVSPEQIEQRIQAGDLILDPAAHMVRCGGNQLHLGPTEFKLLHYLISHREKAFSRTRLLDKVWGPHIYVQERTVDVHIRRLRKALEPHGLAGLIQTVRGAGYRFSELVSSL